MTSPQIAPARELVRQPRRPAEREAAHQRRQRVLQLVLGAATPVLLLAIWQLLATRHWIDARIYPAPTTIFSDARHLASDGVLVHDTWVTTKAILLGFLLGVGVGYVAGAALGLSKTARAALEPLLNALYVVPKLALLPIFLTIFGFGEAPKIVLGAVTVFFFVWIDTMSAFMQVPLGYREAAQSLDVSRRQLFVHVLFPATLPAFFVSLRIAMGVSVLIMVAAEFVVGDAGLGYLIFNSRQLGLNSWMYVGIATVAIEGVILVGCVSVVARVCMPWERRS